MSRFADLVAARNWHIVEINTRRAGKEPVRQDFAAFIRARVAMAE